jgi:hypothetical protein
MAGASKDFQKHGAARYGKLENFYKFCGDGDEWLAYVFLLDGDNNFILCSGTRGKPPNHIRNEAGVVPLRTQATSGSSSDSGRTKSRLSAIGKLGEEMQSSLKESRDTFFE